MEAPRDHSSSRALSSMQLRNHFYRLVVSQLLFDGNPDIAHSLARSIFADDPDIPAPKPSGELYSIVSNALEREFAVVSSTPKMIVPSKNLDFDFTPIESEEVVAPEPESYVCNFHTTHKAPCRALAVHPDGALVASGGEDAAIKILDVDRMVTRSSLPLNQRVNSESNFEIHPVIRTLYDHVLEVTCLSFSPCDQLLLSGSSDYTIKVFDYSDPGTKQAARTIHEASELRCLEFHPSGLYFLAATNHPTLRVYDLNTSECYVSADPVDQHTGPINCVKYNSTGSMYASVSDDGNMHVWDGVSNRRVKLFRHAHERRPVASVAWSANDKYLLTSATDATILLWDVGTGKLLLQYTGAGTIGQESTPLPAVFNHTEDYVLFPDEKSGSLCTWDSRTAARKKLLHLNHHLSVSNLVHIPNIPAFVTTGCDAKVKFWVKKTVVI